MTSLYRAARKLVHLMPAWLIRFRPFVVYEIPLTSAPEAMTNPQRVIRESPSCEIRWIDDDASVAALHPLASLDCIASWNGSTRRIAAAWLGGRPIACAWLAVESFDERELGLRVELAPDEAWLFAAAVAPEYRNQGVYRQLLEFVIDELRRSGVRRLLLGVTVGNEPSHRAHARQGAVEVGRITALRTLGMAFSVCTGRIHNLPRLASPHNAQLRFAVEP